jgi:hypothetical protein
VRNLKYNEDDDIQDVKKSLENLRDDDKQKVWKMVVGYNGNRRNVALPQLYSSKL